MTLCCHVVTLGAENEQYGSGTGPLWFEEVYCDGTEDSLLDCPRDYNVYIPEECSHVTNIVCNRKYSYILAVIIIISMYAAGSNAPSLTSHPLRLVGGDSIYEGRVEILYKRIWGTVCSDGWSLIDSHIVCRQMGFGPALGYYGNCSVLLLRCLLFH